MKFVLKNLFIILVISIIFISDFSLSSLKKRSKKNQQIGRNQWNFPYSTNLQPLEGGDYVFLLDRHNVNAGKDNILRGFHLYIQGDRFAYEFAKEKVNKILGQYQKTTREFSYMDNKLDILSNFIIKCDNNDLIQRFEMKNTKNNRGNLAATTYYVYDCVKLNVGRCYENTSTFEEWQNPEDWKVRFLANSYLFIPNGHGLNSFRFRPEIRKIGNRQKRFWNYDYRYCSLS